jgi:nucleoside-diphosphate-sugar epimerase
MEEPVILVTGATGTTGGELVRLLVEAGAPVRALVRSPDKAASIRRLGVETAVGDFEQPDTLDAAMAGCDHLFLLSPPSPHQPEQEHNAIDAAKLVVAAHRMAGGSLQRWYVNEAPGAGGGDHADIPVGRLGKLDQDQGVTSWGCSADNDVENATALDVWSGH